MTGNSNESANDDGLVVDFIISGVEHPEFGLTPDQLPDAWMPVGARWRHVQATDAEWLEIEGVHVEFSAEPPGWQVTFVEPPGVEWAVEMAQAICDRMADVSGQAGRVIRIQ